eukprot:scaffold47753_cov58-Attheya_sp.AAC.9
MAAVTLATRFFSGVVAFSPLQKSLLNQQQQPHPLQFHHHMGLRETWHDNYLSRGANFNLKRNGFMKRPRKCQKRNRLSLDLSRDPDYQRNGDNDDENGDETTWLLRVQETVGSNPNRSIGLSLFMALAGAALGPFLDSYHSAFGVLQYNHPFSLFEDTGLVFVTTWWVPVLFGLAGFIIGWLYILLDAIFSTSNNNNNNNNNLQTSEPENYPVPVPQILYGISFFTFQYWLSGILFAHEMDRTSILLIMTALAVLGFRFLDNTKSGFITSLATAFGGPLIEVGLISMLPESAGYHYNDAGETGFFPLWIIPVYFLGGPAVGNLARGIWNGLSKEVDGEDGISSGGNDAITGRNNDPNQPKCATCQDTRAVGCPNCDAVGTYVTYGQTVQCNCCKGRGLVICRDCFGTYEGDDPNNIERVRDIMSRMPD